MLAAGVALCLAHAGAMAADDAGPALPRNQATARELNRIVVIGTTPLPGLGLPLGEVPSNVQAAGADDLRRQQSLGVADFLNSSFSGINVNESQNNPFQPDVNYHGFTASPLLGTPEGLSVYVDGVRVNESFGDTVNWDLIPESAISSVTLMSGSNPVFGLNTLGGALSIQTKSGHDNAGTELEVYGGSFGRRAFQAETGGEVGVLDYFITGNVFDENGWRDFSPTRVYQGFGKVGWQNDKTDIDLSYTYADTALIGNGPVPSSLLATRRSIIYTAPDRTHNLLHFFNLTATQFLSDDLLLSGNAYHRRLVTVGLNGDANDDNYQSDEYPGPEIDCGTAPTSLAEVAFCATGINRASRLTQSSTGVGVQLTESAALFGATNQLVIGATFDRTIDDYEQTFRYASLTPDRTAISIEDPFNPARVVNALAGSNKIFGLYVTDTFSPNALLHITVSARYNRNTVILNGDSFNTSLGDFGDGFDEANHLVENHTYSRVNPSVGFTVTPSPRFTGYASYNEASRAPTVIELGCSDPDNPCGLPNAFASDPYLAQVVARTFELGARGRTDDGSFNWSAAVFRTSNRDDIQFVAANTSEGYFANVGGTRRQGVDLGVGGKVAALSWRAVYSFVDATYRSDFVVGASSNSSSNAEGTILVRAGNRIPLIPRHTGRLTLDYAVNDQWEVGANLIASAGIYLHGNENNANQVGAVNGQGATVLGSGWISGYTVVNLRSTYHLRKSFDVFLRIANLFDTHFATAGFLTANSFNADGSFRANPDDWTPEDSVSPAQPRAVWAGVRWRWR